MTIYVVMQHSPEAESVPVSARHYMSTAELDKFEREDRDATKANATITYTIVPVNLGGDR